MITLKKVVINKYKCFTLPQGFDVDEDITVLVGKNESGKTAILEAIAKTKYFNNDKEFIFDAILDYPRKEKKQYDKSGEDATVVEATYTIDVALLDNIAKDIGKDVFVEKEFTYSTTYLNKHLIGGLKADMEKFVVLKLGELKVNEDGLKDKLVKVDSISGLRSLYNDQTKLDLPRKFGHIIRSISCCDN